MKMNKRKRADFILSKLDLHPKGLVPLHNALEKPLAFEGIRRISITVVRSPLADIGKSNLIRVSSRSVRNSEGDLPPGI